MAQQNRDPKNTAETREGHDSLRSFNPHADRNGQDFGQDEPTDLARPQQLQNIMASDPSWQAETARTASDHARLDAVGGGSIATSDATAAETPEENIRRISDPSLSGRPAKAADEAIDRATSSLGREK